MPSFASLTAFASLAFAAIGAALPHGLPTENQALAANSNPLASVLGGLGPSVASKRDLELVELEILTAIANTFGVKLDDLIKIISNKVGVANNANIDALNAVSHQSRELAEVEPVTSILTALGIDAKDLVGVFGNVVGIANNLNVDAANAKAVQGRELLELEALTTIANFIGVDVKDVLKVVGNVVGVANNLNVDAANAKSHQSRELAELEILTTIANTFGVKLEDLIAVVCNTIGIANNGNVSALNAVSHQTRDELLEADVVTAILTSLGINAKDLVGIFGNVVGAANDANVEAANAKSVQHRELAEVEVITAIANFIGVDVKDVVSVIGNFVNVANGLNVEAANAKAIQQRDELVPYHTDIVTVIATFAGIDVSSVLDIIHNKISVLDNLNLEVANAKSIQSRDADIRLSELFPADIAILTSVASVLHLDADQLITIADNKISILPNAHIELLNAKAIQHTGRDGLDAAAPILGAITAASGAALKPRGEPRSLPLIIVDVTAQVQPLCDHISHLINLNLDASATIDLAIPILNQIKAILTEVKVELDVLVANPIEGVLVLKGKVLSVKAVAELVATLLTTVVVVLGLVAKVAATVRIEVVLGLVAEIGVALAVIVGCALQIVGGLLVELTPLVACIAPVILHLNLGALIQVLKIAVKTA